MGLQVQEGHVWEDMKSSASTLATKVGYTSVTQNFTEQQYCGTSS